MAVILRKSRKRIPVIAEERKGTTSPTPSLDCSAEEAKVALPRSTMIERPSTTTEIAKVQAGSEAAVPTTAPAARVEAERVARRLAYTVLAPMPEPTSPKQVHR